VNDQQLTSVFAGSDLSGQPDLPPDYLPSLLSQGRRSVRRRRLTTVLVAAAVVLLVAGLAGVVRPHANGLPPADRGSGAPTLPDHIAPYSSLTGSVSDSPPGRAVMIYEYGSGETINVWQALALSADGDVYRQIDAAYEGSGQRQWLLSADGRTVILANEQSATGALTLLDLTTGKVREVPLPESSGVVLLAVSPDGRNVAYSSAPLPEDMRSGNAIEFQNAQNGKLSIIDLTTGAVTAVREPLDLPVVAAAFAPDGQRLAIQAGPYIRIVSRDGRIVTNTVSHSPDIGLVPQNAWSPDGTRLATTKWREDTWQTLDGKTAGAYVLDSWYGYGVLDLATGSHRPITADTDTFLGWLGSDRALVFTPSTVDNGDDQLAEVALDGPGRTTLSRFDTGRSCELGMQTCQTFKLTVAAGLLPELTVRPAGDPDRGPWPTWALLAVAVPLVIVVLVAGWIVRRRRLRRRRAARQAV